MAGSAPARDAFATLLHQTLDDTPTRRLTFGQMVSAQSRASRTDGIAGPASRDGVASLGPAVSTVTPSTTTVDDRWVPPLGESRVTSTFGVRRHPVTGEVKAHDGIDLAAPVGTPVRAAATGTVTFAGRRGGYGLVVMIDHGDGTQTRYAHQSRLDVHVGDRVAAGQPIGAVGATGLATGPHLHFEIRRDGIPVDPAAVLGRAA